MKHKETLLRHFKKMEYENKIDFGSLSEMLQVARGEYFNGEASELLGD